MPPAWGVMARGTYSRCSIARWLVRQVVPKCLLAAAAVQQDAVYANPLLLLPILQGMINRLGILVNHSERPYGTGKRETRES